MRNSGKGEIRKKSWTPYVCLEKRGDMKKGEKTKSLCLLLVNIPKSSNERSTAGDTRERRRSFVADEDTTQASDVPAQATKEELRTVSGAFPKHSAKLSITADKMPQSRNGKKCHSIVLYRREKSFHGKRKYRIYLHLLRKEDCPPLESRPTFARKLPT